MRIEKEELSGQHEDNLTILSLPSLPFAKFKFLLEAAETLHLPEYKGSALRGGFGHAFRKVVCVDKSRQDCGECLLVQQCAYSRIFETPLGEDAPPFLRRVNRAPHPFVIEPPPDGRTEYRPGEQLEFGLTLFGQGIDYFPYFLYAFDQLGQTGLGRGKGRCRLRQVSALTKSGQWEVVYDGAQKTLHTAEWTRELADIVSEPQASSWVSLQFLTPTRLKQDGHLVNDLSFRTLVFHLLKRASELTHFYGNRATVDWQFRPWLTEAEAVQTVSSDLHWQDWERWSTRQHSRMKLGGLVGQVTFAGLLTPFMPLLRLGEVMHVGKATSFGLGQFRAAESGDEEPE